MSLVSIFGEIVGLLYPLKNNKLDHEGFLEGFQNFLEQLFSRTLPVSIINLNTLNFYSNLAT